MARYRGVGNVAREVVKRYRGVSNVARQITKSYRGVSNVARQFFGHSFTLQWPSIRSSNEYYTVNNYSAGVENDTWKFVVDVTGIKSGKDFTTRLFIYGDFTGKKISFQYTNSYYNAGMFTCELIFFDSAGEKISTTQLTAALTFRTIDITIPSNTYRISIGYWCNPYTESLSSTLIIKDVVIGSESLI